jgi:predicted transport protein
MTIDYYREKKSICSCQIRNSRVMVFLKLGPGSVVPWNSDVMRDVSKIGHHGNGDFEYSLSDPEQLDELHPLLARAYAEAI